jgi:ABC-type transport system involved in multi-copper enzyme maturation permease subunit
MKLRAIIEFTFREGLARKTIIAFATISTLALLVQILLVLLVPDTVEVGAAGATQQVRLTGSQETIGQIQALATGLITFMATILAVFATASILPRTMEKGAIDLLLSKPVSRGSILLGTTLGAVLIVLVNVGYYIAGSWVIVGVWSGYWNWGFLGAVLPITYMFLVLYSAMMVLSIATRSSALSMIVVYAFVFLVDPILENRKVLAELMGNDTIKTVMDFFYYPLPKPDAISKVSTSMVLHLDISWEPLWTSGLFACAMFALAWWLFSKKDF